MNPERPSLYSRLGGVYSIATVVDDFNRWHLRSNLAQEHCTAPSSPTRNPRAQTATFDRCIVPPEKAIRTVLPPEGCVRFVLYSRVRGYALGFGLFFIFLVRAFAASALANGAQPCGTQTCRPCRASRATYQR